MPDNAAALAQVTESERRYNGRLLDKPMSFLFKDGGQDLCLRVEDVNSTWCFQKGADYLEVPFNHIWQAANPNLHCSFTFRSRDRERASKLSLTIGVSQKNSSKKHSDFSALNYFSVKILKIIGASSSSLSRVP